MSSDSATEKDYVEDQVYYMADWIWPSPRVELMKSMLLFFDKITLALPKDLADAMINGDPILAVPLAQQGILVNNDPADVIDKRTAKKLAKSLTHFVSETTWKSGHGHEITLGGFHYGGQSVEAAKHFEAVLNSRGLIHAISGTDLVRLDERVRRLVLIMFASAFRSKLMERGIIVHPLTDSPELASEIDYTARYVRWMTKEGMGPKSDTRRYSLYRDPRDADQISADLLNVGTDLSNVPLDEVLDFRRENKLHYAAYASGLRDFLVTLEAVDPAERRRAQQERRIQLEEQAENLRKISRSAFGLRSAVLLFSLVGAAWTAKHGDIFGSIMAGLTASTQAIPLPEQTVTSYSYILKSRQLGR